MPIALSAAARPFVAAAEGRTMEGLQVEPSGMDEHAFRELYASTARPLRAYLRRVSGSSAVADDLLQETYFRFLRSGFSSDDQTYGRKYLYRIATNLLRDRFRRSWREAGDVAEAVSAPGFGDRVELRSDVGRALGELRARDRMMLWLAYVEGASHEEIAAALDLKASSIRSMLFRARQRMAELLRSRGFGEAEASGRKP